MTAILWKVRLGAILSVLLCAGLFLPSASGQGVKRKKPPQVQQDPMETENSPPPPSSPPEVETPPSPERPAGERDGGSSSSGSRPTHSAGGSRDSRDTSEPGGGHTKAGPFMLNLKLGPALCAYPTGCPHQGVFVLDLGAALTQNRNGYLILPLQLQFQTGVVAVLVPIGFQYDIKVPVRGLYVYPRISAGYAALISDGTQPGLPAGFMHSGVIIPEFGLKYVVHGRWNLGGELFSLPVFVNANGAQIYYRLAFTVGVNF
jgi:hypothetical protein